MKRNRSIALLALEAALCVAFCLAKASLSLADAFAVAIAFPFEQIGAGLRALSLSGRFGNTAALLIYLALGTLPAGFLFYAARKRRLRAEDGLLVLLSALLFAVLYLMANPGKINALFSLPTDSGLAVGKAVLGAAVYSVLAGYAILRVLRLSFESDTNRLYRLLRALLTLLNALFVWAIFGVGFGNLLDAFSSLRAANAGTEAGLGMTYAFAVLKFLADAAPYALDIATIFIIMKLLYEMAADRYSEAAVAAAQKLSVWCAKALVAIVLTNIGFNVLQLAFAGALRNIDSTLNLPVISILFVLAALLFARIAAENQALKQDSDLII